MKGNFMSTKNEQVYQIIVNDGFYSICKTPKEALHLLISLSFSKIQWISGDAIKNWILESLSMIEEAFETRDAKTKRQFTNIRKYLEKDLTREQLQKFIVDVSLACEGLSTLSGFGVCKTTSSRGRKKGKAAQGLNAEKISLYDVE